MSFELTDEPEGVPSTPQPGQPDRDAVVRQMRIMFAAGKSVSQVAEYLHQLGMPFERAHDLAATFAPARSTPLGWTVKAPGLTAILAVIGAIVLTFVYRPWEVTWVDAVTRREVANDSAMAKWTMGLIAGIVLLAFVSTILGVVIDWIIERRSRRPVRKSES